MTRLTQRIRDAMTSPDGGYTVVEMVAVVAILGVVLAIVQGTLINSNKLVSGTQSRLTQIQQGKVAIESMTKNLRTAVRPSQLGATCTGCTSAPAFIAADLRTVTFYANVNNTSNLVGPSMVRYRVENDDKLYEDVMPPKTHAATDFNYQYCAWATPTGCTVRTRVLASGIVPGQTLFTYYDGTGTKISTTALTAAQLITVDSIDVVVPVKANVKSTASTFVQRVSLPNADGS